MSLLKGINPGRLNHKITIMRYQDEEDEYGNSVSALKELKKVWAEIRPLRGNEQLEYYKNVNEQGYKITIRYTDVTTKDVLKYRGRQFLINTIANPLEDNYYLELGCTEKIDHDVKELEEVIPDGGSSDDGGN